MPIASPRLCPLLIDRESDLAALAALLNDAAAGHGRLVLVTGEAGAGKSRLLRELATRATFQGALLCFQLSATMRAALHSSPPRKFAPGLVQPHAAAPPAPSLLAD